MAFIEAPATCLCEMRYSLDGQRIENTLWIKDNLDSLDEIRMLVLATALQTWWDDHLRAFQVDDCVLEEIFITDWSSETAPAIGLTVGLGGDAIAQPAPNVNSLCVSFRTAGRGRSSRGRNYTLGMSESAYSGNYFEVAYTDGIQDAYDNLSTVIGPLDFTHVVVSFQTDGAPRTTALIQPVTQYIIVDNVMDTQRRRSPGRGA